jgi:hypothetical protein
VFGESVVNTRSGVWEFSGSIITQYTGNQDGAATNPWQELGLRTNETTEAVSGRMSLYNPCIITNVNFQNGEKYAADTLSPWQASIITESAVGIGFPSEIPITAPTVINTWQSWSYNAAPETTATVKVSLVLGYPGLGRGYERKIECADVTLTLDSNSVPATAIGDEQTNYILAAVLTNVTTGLAIGVNFAMVEGQILAVDTDNKTVTYLADGSSQFQARTLIGDVRQEWLPLLPGNNTLKFHDTGTQRVDITVEFTERYYSG